MAIITVDCIKIPRSVPLKSSIAEVDSNRIRLTSAQFAVIKYFIIFTNSSLAGLNAANRNENDFGRVSVQKSKETSKEREIE